jgi:hypothetical protein
MQREQIDDEQQDNGSIEDSSRQIPHSLNGTAAIGQSPESRSITKSSISIHSTSFNYLIVVLAVSRESDLDSIDDYFHPYYLHHHHRLRHD